MGVGDWLCKTICLRSVALEEEEEALALWLTIRDGVLNIAIIACVWYILEGKQCPDFYFNNASISSLLTERMFFISNKTDLSEEKKVGLLLPDYSDIATPRMFWDWLHTCIVPVFATHNPVISLDNRLLGRVRLRQLRVRDDTCELAGAFQESFAKCFGIYSYSNEQKESYGPARGTPWEWSSEQSLGGSSFTGEIATYSGSGFYLDIPRDLTMAEEALRELQSNNWIDEATRAVFLDINLYNPDSNVFILVRLYVEMPPTGSLLPRQCINSVKLLVDLTPYQAGVLTAHVLLLVLTLWTLFVQCAEVAFWGWRSYARVWAHYLHMAGVVFGVYLSGNGIYDELVVPAVVLSALRSDQFTDLLSKRYEADNFIVLAVLVLALSWARLLFLSHFGRHSKLTHTLHRALPDIVYFSFMFAILMFSFATLANLVFGSNLYDFRTPSNALLVLLYVIPGYLDYKSLTGSSPTLGPLFYVSFTFIIVFVLYNMFIVILNDTYFGVRDKADGREMYEVRPFAMHCLRRLCTALHVPLPRPRPTPERTRGLRALRTLLLKCKLPRQKVTDFIWKLKAQGPRRTRTTQLAEALRKQQFERPASWEHYTRLLQRFKEMENGLHVLDSVLDQLIPELR